MADDEVATLKRELEALKLQLEQERKKNSAVQGGGAGTKLKSKPELGQTQRDESKRRDDDKKTAPSSSKEPRVYVQHTAVGARRGKWWLRDRQVLSRATPDEDDTMKLKVRETWVWSGRTVVLDKIVRLDEEKQEEGRTEEDKEVEKDKPETNGTSEVPPNPVEGAAQPSDVAEISEAASTEREETVDSKVVVPAAAKADDEVREPAAAIEISDVM